MQITDLAIEEKITPLWRLGFRPFFLFGGLFSVIAIAIWQLIYTGHWVHTPYGGGYWWHIHEMTFGFTMAIIAGFLLTAIQNWTGLRGASGTTLIVLSVLWLTPRILMLLPFAIPQAIIIISDLAFLPAVAWVLAKPIIAIKQYRNLFFVPLLITFTLLNALTHYSVIAKTPMNFPIISHAIVILICLLISIMAGRVTPMFTANGTGTQKVPSLPWLEKSCAGLLIASFLTLLLSAFIAINQQVIACLFIAAGTVQFIRWFRWKPWITYNTPLLWSLHGGMKFLWLGLIILGVSYLIPSIPKHHIWHLLTIGTIGGIILAMISRVSLGHTGRPLTVNKWMVFAFACISFSAIARSVGPWLYPEYTLWFIKLSSGLWLLSFVLFTINYLPILSRPRIDGRPG